jgi:hypothetical protein
MGTDIAGVATWSRCGRVRIYPGPIPHKVSKGHRIGPPYHSYDQIPRHAPTAIRGLDYIGQRLVTQDESFLLTRRDAVAVDRDLDIGAAYADQTRPDQHGPVGCQRLA